MRKILTEGADLQNVYEKFYQNKYSWDDFYRLASIDPTNRDGNHKGKYLQWLDREVTQNYKGNVTRFIKDNGSKTFEALQWFNGHINSLPNDVNKDINNYNFQTLCDLQKNYGNCLTQSEKKQQAEVVFNNSEWEIVIPKSWEASKLYGSNTQWCTASNQSSKWFEHYTNSGNLYINIDKRNGAKWQFHFETCTFCDAKDNKLLRGNVQKLTNMPQEVLEWYQNNVPNSLAELTGYDEENQELNTEMQEIGHGLFLCNFGDEDYGDWVITNREGEMVGEDFRYTDPEIRHINDTLFGIYCYGDMGESSIYNIFKYENASYVVSFEGNDALKQTNSYICGFEYDTATFQLFLIDTCEMVDEMKVYVEEKEEGVLYFDDLIIVSELEYDEDIWSLHCYYIPNNDYFKIENVTLDMGYDDFIQRANNWLCWKDAEDEDITHAFNIISHKTIELPTDKATYELKKMAEKREKKIDKIINEKITKFICNILNE